MAHQFFRAGASKLAPVLVAISVVLTTAEQAIATDARPITKIESRRLPPLVVTRRVLSQLANVLHLQAYPSGGPAPRYPLSELWYWTTPHATYVSGLCAADQIVFQFRPTSRNGNGASTKTVVNAISANTYYHFLSAPSSEKVVVLDQTAIFDADERCALLDPTKEMTLRAPDEETAQLGYWWLGEIARRTHQTDQSYILDCSRESSHDACVSDMLQISQKDVSEISKCEGAELGVQCIQIDMFGNNRSLGLRLYLSSNANGPTSVRVAPNEYVIVADQKAD